MKNEGHKIILGEWLGNGYSEKITAYHSAQVDTDACSGLLPVVIERIMSNPSVVRYLSVV